MPSLIFSKHTGMKTYQKKTKQKGIRLCTEICRYDCYRCLSEVYSEQRTQKKKNKQSEYNEGKQQTWAEKIGGKWRASKTHIGEWGDIYKARVSALPVSVNFISARAPLLSSSGSLGCTVCCQTAENTHTQTSQSASHYNRISLGFKKLFFQCFQIYTVLCPTNTHEPEYYLNNPGWYCKYSGFLLIHSVIKEIANICNYVQRH